MLKVTHNIAMKNINNLKPTKISEQTKIFTHSEEPIHFIQVTEQKDFENCADFIKKHMEEEKGIREERFWMQHYISDLAKTAKGDKSNSITSDKVNGMLFLSKDKTNTIQQVGILDFGPDSLLACLFGFYNNANIFSKNIAKQFLNKLENVVKEKQIDEIIIPILNNTHKKDIKDVFIKEGYVYKIEDNIIYGYCKSLKDKIKS